MAGADRVGTSPSGANPALASETTAQCPHDSSGADEVPREAENVSTAAVPMRKRRTENRSESSYPRKRASQACFVCRARKSRCDNERPVCGFCKKSGTECGYPGVELAKIDTASLLILDHVARAEARLSAQIAQLQCASSKRAVDESREAPVDVVSPRPTQRFQVTHPRFGHNSINGDSVMCWPVMQDILRDMSEASRWGVQPDSVTTPPGAQYEPSPSIILEIKSSDDIAAREEEQDQDQARLARVPEFAGSSGPEHESHLIEMYFAHVHSKSPIFDAQWFYSLRAQISQQGWRPQYYAGPSSCRGVCPTRICIYLLVLALGHVAANHENHFPGRGIASSLYFDLALSWMGPSTYHRNGRFCPREKTRGDGEDMLGWIEKIQCLLLIGTHFMWCMRPWDARKVFGEAAILTKTFMHFERWSDELPPHITDLRFRVCCAAAKAESEMQEEIMGFGPGGASILGFEDLENLPKPPSDSTPSGESSDAVASQTWFYYLAEVASWKLLNRVFKELYQDLPLSPSLADFATLHPIARELETQIQDWASSLPTHIFAAPSPHTNRILTEELSHHLKNRHFHARITTFRPFLQAIALGGRQNADEQAYATVLESAVKCVLACIEFLEAQPSPRRHFGSWRCGRGIWAAGLSVLAAVGTPDLRAAMKTVRSHVEKANTGGGQEEVGSLLLRAEKSVRLAATWLYAWERESSSLGVGAQTLWAGLQEANRRGLFGRG